MRIGSHWCAAWKALARRSPRPATRTDRASAAQWNPGTPDGMDD
jgi:hypothetical protein